MDEHKLVRWKEVINDPVFGLNLVIAIPTVNHLAEIASNIASSVLRGHREGDLVVKVDLLIFVSPAVLALHNLTKSFLRASYLFITLAALMGRFGWF